MRRLVAVLLTVLLLPAVVPRLRGQASSPPDQNQLAFEVASVKLNPSGDGSRRGIGSPPGGRLMMTDLPLRTILRFAYDIQSVQLVGGPSWIDTDFFDIEAKAPSAVVASNAQVPMATFRAMTRSLLADRFKLSARREARQLPIYELVVARKDGRLGPQLQHTSVDCETLERSNQSPPPPKDGQPMCGGLLRGGNLQLNGWSMPRLAVNLATWVDRIVVDRTGLSGGFNLKLEWSLDERPRFDALGGPGRPVEGPVDRTGPSIFSAVEEQLGLKLQPTTGPVDVLVIEHLEKPTPD
ncbi:MAG TPA: TIGR03435 family protein [Vicinamibacterales bacterium]|nr:TIGR03435 family protein [Vicinamibacterales bacterium]